MARAGFAGRRRKSVSKLLLNSSDTGCADSTADNVGTERSSVEREGVMLLLLTGPILIF